MKEYIERAAVEKMLEDAQLISDGEYCGYCTEDVNLNSIPAADVAPVRHGTWKLKMVGVFGDLKQYSCSECGFSLLLNPTKIPPYCEDCGAKMSLEEVQNG